MAPKACFDALLNRLDTVFENSGNSINRQFWVANPRA